MIDKITLGYLYYLNSYYQRQLTLHPELKQFYIVP
jgi:hypothetical protein